jgi:hypothetical protein
MPDDRLFSKKEKMIMLLWIAFVFAAYYLYFSITMLEYYGLV